MIKKRVTIDSLNINDKFTYSGNEYINKGVCTVNSRYNTVINVDGDVFFINTDTDVWINIPSFKIKDISYGQEFLYNEKKYIKVGFKGVCSSEICIYYCYGSNNKEVIQLSNDTIVYLT